MENSSHMFCHINQTEMELYKMALNKPQIRSTTNNIAPHKRVAQLKSKIEKKTTFQSKATLYLFDAMPPPPPPPQL